jgi:hypothetical protein
MFDCGGYSEEKLLELSNDYKRKFYMMCWKHGIVEMYSYGRLLREYGFFPQFLPIYIYHLHGPGIMNFINEHEINSGAYCMFVNTEEDAQQFIAAGMKRCEVMLHPFVFYRRKYKVHRDANARGTLVFPAHSIFNTEELTDIDEYIRQLKELPDIYKPLAICLHCEDINKGKHRKYMDAGFPVYTAGHTHNYRYVERFYDVLRHFKYSTSNAYGSYIYYAVEMGIPFFLHGDEVEYYNKADPGLPLGRVKIAFPNVLRMCRMFSEMTTVISDEQRMEIERGLGISDGISRLKMAKILYSALFSNIFG